MNCRRPLRAFWKRSTWCLEKKKRCRQKFLRACSREFKKMTEDFKALDAEIAELREKEQVFEKGQEGFYQAFKAAVAEVQAAKEQDRRMGKSEPGIGAGKRAARRCAAKNLRIRSSRRAAVRKNSRSYHGAGPARGDLARDGAAHVPPARRSGRQSARLTKRS